MTENEMLEWAQTATLKELLRKCRFERIGSAWFKPGIGDLILKRIEELKKEDPAMFTRISKELGWDNH